MKRLKGFSLAEMIIVISIILLFILVFQNLFKPKNIQIYDGQKCVNYLYSFINTFVTEGLTSKGFNSGGIIIYPTEYLVQFNYAENKIINQINGNTGRKIINLSGLNTSQICHIGGIYNIIISGNLGQISITGSNNNQFELFKTDGTSIITGNTDLFLCENGNIRCINIGKYLLDKRSQTVIKKVCLSFSGSNCRQWNQ